MASSQLSPLAGDPYCDNARRRTCKACDRCRLKKTKVRSHPKGVEVLGNGYIKALRTTQGSLTG
jgi:hypothetical protein